MRFLSRSGLLYEKGTLLRIFNRCNSSVDEHFIHKSTLKTSFFQPALPRLPLPSLSKSINNLKTHAGYLMSLDDKTKFNDELDLFLTTVGPRLQEELTAKASKQNYMADLWWQSYLESRSPTAFSGNAILGLFDDPYAEENQLIRAARIINFASRFILTLKHDVLYPDIYPNKYNYTVLRDKIFPYLNPVLAYGLSFLFVGFPLDMSSYYNFFGGCRIPALNCDKFSVSSLKNTNHIVVMNKGNFFKLDIFKSHGVPYNISTIKGALEDIINSKEAEVPLGIFTTLNRDDWANVRSKIISLEENRKNLKLIEDALFIVCLDDDMSSTDEVMELNHFMKANPHNRFFDKSLQLIIDKKGSACINFEHTCGDGLPLMRLLDEVSVLSKSVPHVVQDVEKLNPHLIQIKNLEECKTETDYVLKNFADITNSLDIDFCLNNRITQKLLKSHELSGDALMQLIFQYTYKKTFGYIPSIYESVTMLAFADGRTDIMRPVNDDTIRFVDLLDSESETHSFLDQLKIVSERHKKELINVLKGKGFDRHIFVLDKLSEGKGEEIRKKAAFFDSGRFKKHFSEFQISSSTLASKNIKFGLFAPPWRKCIGLPYSINKERAGAIITNFLPTHGGIDGKKFKNELILSFERFEKILGVN